MARAKKGGLGRGLDSLIPIGIMEETEEVEREVADRKAARARVAKLANESKKLNESIGVAESKGVVESTEIIESKGVAESTEIAGTTGLAESKDLERVKNTDKEKMVKAGESKISSENYPERSLLGKSPSERSSSGKSPSEKSLSEKSSSGKSLSETPSSEKSLSGKLQKVSVKTETKMDGGKGPEEKEVQLSADQTVNIETSDMQAGSTEVEGEKEQGGQLSGTAMLKVSEIEPNREQPRKDFNEDALQELAESIRLHGVIQPLIVQRRGEYYGIIAGERRWRAAKIAGLKEVPVIIREYTDREVMEISLIENIQREDLNAIEEAKAYQRLIQEFHLKQEDIAVKISKSRAAIANTMRLLKLDERVQNMLIEEEISSGHARALLPLEDGDLQYNAAQKIASEALSVRETEKLVKLLLTPPKEPDEPKDEPVRDDRFIYQALEEKMKSIMGTKVSIHKKDNNKGRIEIEYYSPEELERIVELFETIK